jgi:hypothetical protein
MCIHNSRVEVVNMEQTQKNWIAKTGMLPRTALRWGIAQTKSKYTQLKHRYGLWYTIAILSVAVVTYPVPIPGITMSSVALVVLIAEAHRAIFQQKRPSGDYCQSGGCSEN